jgi:hypothetical protein
MKKSNLDRTLSSSIILITLAFVLFGLSNSDLIETFFTYTIKEHIDHSIKYNLDFVLIFYIFLCLQVSGYVELKYKKDYLLISIMSILFTPLAIFFIIKDKDKDKND